MKKLKRSRSDKVIMGVCGGLGEYLNMDATIIRIVWFVLALTSFGTFALAYIICGLVIPEDDGYIEADGEERTNSSENGKFILGGALILIGLFMLGNILFPWFSYMVRQLTRLWPALLILLGAYIIIKKN